MDYGIMTYDFQDRFNVGDYIQSLAARQFLPRVDRYVGREELDRYSGPEMKVILNGFFMRHPEHWPPASNIIPLFLSFHMNVARAAGMLTPKGVAYLKDHGPVGCRDLGTLERLQERNIEGYFSNCLTLTLGNSYHHTGDEDICFVDVLFGYPTWKTVFRSFNSFQKSVRNKDIFRLGRQSRLIRQLLGQDMVQAARQVTHVYPAAAFPTEDSRFALADRILKQYEKARLVVTSRIHCALPCLALGTPVIFVNGGFGQTHACRFGGISQLFNTIEIREDGSVETNFDLDDARRNGSVPPRSEHLPYVDRLIERCRKFVAGDE